MKPANANKPDWSLADGLWAELSNREISQRVGEPYQNVIARRKKLIRQAQAAGSPTTPFEPPPKKVTRKTYDFSKGGGLVGGYDQPHAGGNARPQLHCRRGRASTTDRSSDPGAKRPEMLRESRREKAEPHALRSLRSTCATAFSDLSVASL